ncbi:MAG: response regulator [Clostridia bacterium]|nr:response regulator [Clostridia bacterium]
MLTVAVYSMIYLGSALMVFNIYGFIRYAGEVKSLKHWGSGNAILHIPIFLLVMFLLGYLAVGIFGNPDIIVSGILFGGSIFVFIMYILLTRITRRIIKSERLESELMAAEQTNKVKNEFLATVSHEMRTPLNVIIGLNNSALHEPGLPGKAKADLERVGHSAKHLLGLINNILDINRIESGRFKLKQADFELEAAVDQINALLNTMCSAKGLIYNVSVEDGAKGRYSGDEAMLKQVLIAVLDNAVKYTDAPGVVEFSVRSVGESEGVRSIEFIIKDSGVGIDNDFIPKMFEVFTQEDATSTNRYGGSGLGLAVSRDIVELMGGEIKVSSLKNCGSTFTVSVPLAIAKGSLGDADEPDGGSDIPLAGKRILIVEDLDENAEIVADLLELEDAQTERAENGKVALEKFVQSPQGYYDAILMDLRMPVMDGLASTRAIRASRHPDASSVPIIALTANAFDSDVKQAIEAGMNAHLAKPADSEKLYSTIKHYIAKRELEANNK